MIVQNIKPLVGAALSLAFLAVSSSPAAAQANRFEDNRFENQPWRTNQLRALGENVRIAEIDSIVGDIAMVDYIDGGVEHLGLSRPQAASIVPGNCVLTADEEILRVVPCNSLRVSATYQPIQAIDIDAILGPVRQPSMELQRQ
ncbi:MAG: hypothetical protein ACOC04_06190 [Halothece sp.]